MEHRVEPFGILIVEDDQLLGRVLERVISCDGQAAVHVGDGSHAMRLLKQHVPRVALIDSGLRDGTALKLVEAIGANFPALHVILWTAHRLGDSALSRCVHQVATKSIDLPELRRIVRAALRETTPCARKRERDFVGLSAPWNETASSPVPATSTSR
jgi:DNA-binding NtrC family response regulator